jgi:hypothetical protein
MTDSIVELHRMAPAHLPSFIPGPDGSDGMFGTMTILIVVAVFVLGTIYFKLHSLPEHLAAGLGRAHYQLVGILALLALFTHENMFWVAALILAVVQIPDVMTPVRSIADSLESMNRAVAAARTVPPSSPVAADQETTGSEGGRNA